MAHEPQQRRALGDPTNDGSIAARDAKNHCKAGTVREIAARFRGASIITTEQRLREQERHERLEHRHHRRAHCATASNTFRCNSDRTAKVYKGRSSRACQKVANEGVAEDSFDREALFDEMLGMMHVGQDSGSDGGRDGSDNGGGDNASITVIDVVVGKRCSSVPCNDGDVDRRRDGCPCSSSPSNAEGRVKADVGSDFPVKGKAVSATGALVHLRSETEAAVPALPVGKGSDFCAGARAGAGSMWCAQRPAATNVAAMQTSCQDQSHSRPCTTQVDYSDHTHARGIAHASTGADAGLGAGAGASEGTNVEKCASEYGSACAYGGSSACESAKVAENGHGNEASVALLPFSWMQALTGVWSPVDSADTDIAAQRGWHDTIFEYIGELHRSLAPTSSGCVLPGYYGLPS